MAKKSDNVLRPSHQLLACSVPCLECGRVFVPAAGKGSSKLIGVPILWLNNYCSRQCLDRASNPTLFEAFLSERVNKYTIKDGRLYAEGTAI